jgi:Berberine and berberine like
MGHVKADVSPGVTGQLIAPGHDDYDELVKAGYDPDNIFRLNQNITPGTQS